MGKVRSEKTKDRSIGMDQKITGRWAGSGKWILDMTIRAGCPDDANTVLKKHGREKYAARFGWNDGCRG
jgi:hypothetical protein